MNDGPAVRLAFQHSTANNPPFCGDTAMVGKPLKIFRSCG